MLDDRKMLKAVQESVDYSKLFFLAGLDKSAALETFSNFNIYFANPEIIKFIDSLSRK